MENNNIEEFKIIAEFQNYEVSNFGNIRNINTQCIRVPYLNKKDNVYQIKIGKTKTLHRLVAEAFIENVDNKLNINHIDGNKLNNHATNLRYATRQECMRVMAVSPTSLSGCKGVIQLPNKLWRSQIKVNGKSISLGCYTNKEDAINARKQKENMV